MNVSKTDVVQGRTAWDDLSTPCHEQWFASKEKRKGDKHSMRRRNGS